MSELREIGDTQQDQPEFRILEADYFRQRRKAIFRGFKQLRGRAAVLVLSPVNRPDAQVATWEHGMLKRKLATVRHGVTVFLTYLGTEPHPTMEGKSQHVWRVEVEAEPATPGEGGVLDADPLA